MKKSKIYSGLAVCVIALNVAVGPAVAFADELDPGQEQVVSEEVQNGDSTLEPDASSEVPAAEAPAETPVEQPAEVVPPAGEESQEPVNPEVPESVTYSATFVDEAGNILAHGSLASSEGSATFATPEGYATADGLESVTLTAENPTATITVKLKESAEKPEVPGEKPDGGSEAEKPGEDGKEEEKPAETEKPEEETPAEKPEVPAETPVSEQPAAEAPASTGTQEGAATGSYVAPISYNYSFNDDTAKFVASIAEQARIVAKDNNLYASVMIAQAILESGSGSSTLSQAPNNNIFGIKGRYNDQYVSLGTQEDDGSGNLYSITSEFKVYENTGQSMQDYADLIKYGTSWNPDAYKGSWKSETESYRQAAAALQGNYATDTSYASKLTGLIEKYELDQYDQDVTYVKDQYDTKNASGQEVADVEAGKVAGSEIPSGKLVETDAPVIDSEADSIVRLLSTATSQLGVPYVWGGTTLDGNLDCSGLTQQVYLKALGIQIPRVTTGQETVGEEVALTVEDLQPGDLLFFGPRGGTTHVAMYLTNGYFIHAPEPGKTVEIQNMNNYQPSFAKRILGTEEKTEEVANQEKAALAESLSLRVNEGK